MTDGDDRVLCLRGSGGRWPFGLLALGLLGSCGGGGGGGGGAGGGGAGGSNGSSAGNFVVRVPAAVSAPQSSHGRLRVRVERSAGFADAVEVGLVAPPPGVFANAASTASDEAWLPLQISGTVPLGALDLTIVGRAAGKTATASLRVDVSAPQPRAQELIRAALDAGRIDLGTSLLYRAYALFGDARLPSEFVGSGPAEDGLLVVDIEEARPTLSPATLDQLQPFLVRPADATSWFNVGASPGSGGATGTMQGPLRRAALADASRCSGGQREWINERSTKYPVRAWALCLGTQPGDEGAMNDLFKILDVVDKAYGEMVDLMGPAKADLWGDDAIDVYAVPPGAGPPREKGDYAFEDDEAGVTIPQRPQTGGPWGSAYVMMPTVDLRALHYQMYLIHELFHVLQNAHNYLLRNWFVEASAEWAAAHFNRIAPILPADNTGQAEDWFGAFQESREGLRSMVGDHEYEAYVWPLFMEQERSDGAIAEAWNLFESVGASAEQADIQLSTVLPFAENFHLFAMRNMNEALEPGNALPVRYHALDGAFPEDYLWPDYKEEALVGDRPIMLPVSAGELAARYFRFTAPADGSVESVDFDFSGLEGLEHANVDAFILNPDGWVPHFVPLDGEKRTRFCFDRGPSTETVRGSFDEVRLIISNHDLDLGSTPSLVEGTLTVRPYKAGCAGWAGQVMSDLTQEDPATQTTVVLTSVANVELVPDPDPPGGAIPGIVTYKVKTGTLTYHSALKYPGCHGENTKTTTMVPGPPGAMGEGLTVISLQTFGTNGKPQYGRINAYTSTVNTFTLMCEDGDITMTNPNSMVSWWAPPDPAYDLKLDGTVMEERQVRTVSGAMQTWSLYKVDN